jgi:hypothetical protein
MYIDVQIPTKAWLKDEDIKSVAQEFFQKKYAIDSVSRVNNGYIVTEFNDYHGSSINEQVRQATAEDVLACAVLQSITHEKSIIDCLPSAYRDALLALDSK